MLWIGGEAKLISHGIKQSHRGKQKILTKDRLSHIAG
jgi:hypothetical protein